MDIQNEAEEAGNKALKIFANLTSLPLVDTKTLEVSTAAATNAIAR